MFLVGFRLAARFRPQVARVVDPAPAQLQQTPRSDRVRRRSPTSGAVRRHEGALLGLRRRARDQHHHRGPAGHAGWCGRCCAWVTPRSSAAPGVRRRIRAGMRPGAERTAGAQQGLGLHDRGRGSRCRTSAGAAPAAPVWRKELASTGGCAGGSGAPRAAAPGGASHHGGRVGDGHAAGRRRSSAAGQDEHAHGGGQTGPVSWRRCTSDSHWGE